MPVQQTRRDESYEDERADYEAEMLVIARAQLEAQQRIQSYLGFFFWWAVVVLALAVGGGVAGLVAHYSS